jgi:hypothetical protein
VGSLFRPPTVAAAPMSGKLEGRKSHEASHT